MEDYKWQHTAEEENIEHEHTYYITCPYCGHEDQNRERLRNITNAHSDDLECKNCHKMFVACWRFDDDVDEDSKEIVFITYHENQSRYV